MKFYLIILTIFPQLAFAGIFKVVTENGSVTYSNVRLENSTRLDVLDKRWKLVSEEGFTEDRLYYDSKNIKKK